MLTLTADQWATLKTVNTAVNALPYKTDLDLYKQADFWQRIGVMGAGDCEDYAIEKRARLIAAGFAPHELRLATCLDETGAPHAVLTIDTDTGTLVLDNRWPDVASADELTRQGYKWLDRQAPNGGFLWVHIVT